MTLDELNRLPAADAYNLFFNCCAVTQWAQSMADARPYSSPEALHQQARNLWPELSEADWLAAFEAHPKIGDIRSLKAKYASTKTLASGEQSGVNSASEEVLQRLAQGNTAYEEKFGFIFIVCATGRSAAEMLALLEARLPNSRDQEIPIAAAEQIKITHIRLDKFLGESGQAAIPGQTAIPGSTTLKKSPITTHILDQGTGRPAADVLVTLERQTDSGWQQLAVAITNADGRIMDAFGDSLEAGIYRLTFDTDGYYQRQDKSCFYPNVSICFRVADPAAHYHVPLLLNQWGYSTYRGS